jgi:hypothetical protein
VSARRRPFRPNKQIQCPSRPPKRGPTPLWISS